MATKMKKTKKTPAQLDREIAEALATRQDLSSQREKAAQAAFENYDFGADVEAFDGWEKRTPGDAWWRTVYLGGEQGGDSVASTFTVVFKPGTAVIKEVF